MHDDFLREYAKHMQEKNDPAAAELLLVDVNVRGEDIQGPIGT